VTFFIFWGPHAQSGGVIERQQQEREPKENRLDEESGMVKLEPQFQEAQRYEQAKENAWERELAERRLDEELRTERLQRQLKMKQRQEKTRQDEWDERQDQKRLGERLREQRQREEEERQRQGLYWSNPEANAKCTAYNTREYRARLLNNVPYHYNLLKPCEEIPIVIHDRSVRTTRCEIGQNVSPVVVCMGESKLIAAARAWVRCTDIGVWILMNPHAPHIGINSRTK
jgi:hypothetical protein